MAGSSRDVLLAAVVGAQGLKGEVRVKAFTSEPVAVANYGGLHTKDGRRFTVTAARATKPDEAILTLAEITDRTAAEGLKGTELYVTRDALPPTDDDEFYHADLIGLRAEDETGRVLGTVHAILNYGAGDVIEIARPSSDGSGGDTVLLPFTRETVPVIEIAKGRIQVAVPEEVEAGGEHGNVE
ncbi:MAG TPA: ribosome maturation factor RimM [Rhizomicrobium sp.]|nr:ribosome maturation factor RimM [Rhizomicrobium sp.]